MQRARWQILAIGAGLTAVIAAIATGRLPRWLRVTLVLGISVLACGSALYAYRYFTRPTTLTVAAGSADGAASHFASAQIQTSERFTHRDAHYREISHDVTQCVPQNWQTEASFDPN